MRKLRPHGEATCQYCCQQPQGPEDSQEHLWDPWVKTFQKMLPEDSSLKPEPPPQRKSFCLKPSLQSPPAFLMQKIHKNIEWLFYRAIREVCYTAIVTGAHKRATTPCSSRPSCCFSLYAKKLKICSLFLFVLAPLLEVSSLRVGFLSSCSCNPITQKSAQYIADIQKYLLNKLKNYCRTLSTRSHWCGTSTDESSKM